MLGNVRTSIPHFSEQVAIAAYLNVESAKMDAFVGKAAAVIERLPEFVIAMITEAVTGKIDVRKQLANS